MWTINRVRPLILETVLLRSPQFSSLLVQNPKLGWKHSQQQGLKFLPMMAFRDTVPTEMVPALAAPFAGSRIFDPTPDVPPTHINRCRAIEENVDSLTARLPGTGNQF